MDFSDYLETVLKQRQQQANKPVQNKQQPVWLQQRMEDKTSQSTARDAIAKAQEDASVRAEQETKAPHVRINGRYMSQEEAQAKAKLQTQAAPANADRIAYIESLKKTLRAKKYQ
ncbi:hypothetical protein L6J37_05705 [Photobacterium sp. WH77]|uniref:Uncharacterized protein n=2 Tax=Photobacterium TaxID=657 RepID=A0A7X4WUQ9_9GAMM|nr:MULTISPECIES: hypothetical protein [Photobacterium]MBD8513890.1 hypothetical protein [Photobacterium arenosum]MBV7262468.1 hypothetical protein [Photobacterium sp. WH24]MCG2836358.1 hypothetical protein [Photobacterium sp. WH77]MCG2844015.1 hypothetical protein [Photobacterium sp. WH80]MDO6580441.1 hypothetical protein [Photobacterium sp. 2_MG-2023]